MISRGIFPKKRITAKSPIYKQPRSSQSMTISKIKKLTLTVSTVLALTACATLHSNKAKAPSNYLIPITGGFGIQLGEPYDKKFVAGEMHHFLEQDMYRTVPPEHNDKFSDYYVGVTPIEKRVHTIVGREEVPSNVDCISDLSFYKEQMSAKYGDPIEVVTKEHQIGWISQQGARSVYAVCDLKHQNMFIVYRDEKIHKSGEYEKAPI